MTIDEIECTLNSIKIVLEHTEKGYYPEQFKTHEECLKEVMDIVRKYQQLQADYENRLKTDLKAMLKEIQDEIFKESWRLECICDDLDGSAVDWDDIKKIIQEKINSLKKNKK